MLVEASHRSGDRLERLVDGGDVAEQDDEGADRDVAAEDGGEAEAEDERRSKRRRGLDAEGEPRLADGQLDPLVDGGLALVSERLNSYGSRPNVTITRSMLIASFTIESDCHSRPWTTWRRGTIFVP